MIRRALLLVVLATVIVPTSPRLLDLVRQARAMRPLPWKERREKLMPDLYPAIEKIDESVPLQQPIALVAGSIHDLAFVQPFVNYYLYPHPTISYASRWAYAMARDKPKIIVRLAPNPAVVTYGELRYDEIRRSRIVRNPQLPAEGRSEFMIPIVTSTEGPQPVVYTIEGAIASDGEAHVTLTLEPDGITRTLTIRGTQQFDDLVYQCFGVMRFIDWIRVTSDKPVRAAFWLVNRDARTATPLHLPDGALKHAAAFPDLGRSANLWLVNFDDEPERARIGPHDALLLPHQILGVPADGTVSGAIYAFISRKLPDGATQFIWPEDLK